MSSQGNPRRALQKPGKKQRQALKAGQAPRNEREQAYVATLPLDVYRPEHSPERARRDERPIRRPSPSPPIDRWRPPTSSTWTRSSNQRPQSPRRYYRGDERRFRERSSSPRGSYSRSYPRREEQGRPRSRSPRDQRSPANRYRARSPPRYRSPLRSVDRYRHSYRSPSADRSRARSPPRYRSPLRSVDRYRRSYRSPSADRSRARSPRPYRVRSPIRRPSPPPRPRRELSPAPKKAPVNPPPPVPGVEPAVASADSSDGNKPHGPVAGGEHEFQLQVEELEMLDESMQSQDEGDEQHLPDEDYGDDHLFVGGSDSSEAGSSNPHPESGKARGNAQQSANNQQFGAEQYLAAAERVSDAEIKAIREAIRRRAEEDDNTAKQVNVLLEHLETIAVAQGKELARASFKFSEETETHLWYQDLLSLFYVSGYEEAAYFTENIIQASLQYEVKGVDGVYLFCDASAWLDTGLASRKEFRESREADIRKAREEQGKPNSTWAPTLGWPLPDLAASDERIVFTYNPSRVHWVAVEITISDQPKLLVYNSWKANTRPGGGLRAAQEDIPLLLELASLRPGSPLAGIDWKSMRAESPQCPQQGSLNVDCGPFALYFVTQRMHKLPLTTPLTTPALNSDGMRHAFGQWLRCRCIESIHSTLDGGVPRDMTTLRYWFNHGQPSIEQLRASVPMSAGIVHQWNAGGKDSNHRLDKPANRKKSGTSGNQAQDADVMEVGQAVVDNLSGQLIEAADAGQDNELKHGPWRIELDESDGRAKTIIIIIRYSSVPYWHKRGMPFAQIKQRLVAHALSWFHAYKDASGDTRTEKDAVVHVSYEMRTKYMPDFVENDQDGGTGGTGGNDETTAEIHCTICTYKFRCDNLDRRCPAKVLVPIMAHMTPHMLAERDWLNNTTQEKGVWSCRCEIPECTWTTSDAKKWVANRNARTHYRDRHTRQWLDDNEDAIVRMTCTICVDCQGEWSWHQRKEFFDHLNGIKRGRREYKCPYCLKTCKSMDGLDFHVQTKHNEDRVPQGWHRCDRSIMGNCETWGQLGSNLKKMCSALDISGGLFCAWAPDHCETSTPFRNRKLRESHYNAVHRDDIWPFSTPTCGRTFSSIDALLAHQMHQHQMHQHQMHRHVRNREALNRIRRARCIRFTEAIAEDLNQAAASDPIILSVGIDGFTCNGPLLLAWLRHMDVRFQFVFGTTKLATLDAQLLHRVDETFWGFHDSVALATGLSDPTQASPALKDLIQTWAQQQANKDQQAKVRVVRNVMAAGHTECGSSEEDAGLA